MQYITKVHDGLLPISRKSVNFAVCVATRQNSSELKFHPDKMPRDKMLNGKMPQNIIPPGKLTPDKTPEMYGRHNK